MSSECVLEFRSPGDDAWYSARVAVEGEVLRVNYLGFSEEDDEVFRASSFKSRREVDVFKDRFRAVSIQVEDSNCSEVVTGDRVCASFSFHDDDVRFYDAFVDGVERREHARKQGGEEECSCAFILTWLHGPNAENSTATAIENICQVWSTAPIDPKVTSFLEVARERFRINREPALISKAGGGSNSKRNMSYFDLLNREKGRAKRTRAATTTCTYEGRIDSHLERTTCSRPSTSCSSNTRSSFTNEKWQRRALTLETHFAIKDNFKRLEATKWAVRAFKKRRLYALFKPCTDTVFPRHVCLFYQNLTYDCDRPNILTSSLDGVDMDITVEDIALALDCPHECPSDLAHSDGTPRYKPFPTGLSVQAMVDDMCAGRYTNKHRNCTSKSKLPPALWFVDSVLHKNVCPLGHKIQRRGAFLQALYAVHKGYWFSAPALIWDQMHKCWDGMINKRTKKANTWSLPVPCLVTKLLQAKGVVFLDEDHTLTDFPQFRVPQWNQSVSHMPIMEAEVHDDDESATEEMDEDTAEADAAQPEENVDQDGDDASMHDTITRAQYTYLCDKVTRLSFEIANHRRVYREDQLRNEQAHMQTQQLLQSLLERFPPPP